MRQLITEFMTTQVKEDKPDAESTGAIWNPSAARWWSLIFTPIFGIYIHKLNWETLNKSQRVSSTKRWLYIGLIILATNFLTVNLFGLSGLVTLYLIIWYFTDGESQIKYVEEKFGGRYLHKSWKKPILIMSSVYFAFIGISFYLFVYEFYNFTITDKVRHALYYANDAQLAFADYLQEYHRFPNNLVEAGFTLKSPSESIKDINLHKEDKIVVLSLTMAVKPIEDKKLFLIVLSIENYTFNRIFNHNLMIYNDKYQFSLSHV